MLYNDRHFRFINNDKQDIKLILKKILKLLTFENQHDIMNLPKRKQRKRKERKICHIR